MSNHRACAPRSMRAGNAPSPYTKYQKRPANYAAMYRKVIDKDPTSHFAVHLRCRKAGNLNDA